MSEDKPIPADWFRNFDMAFYDMDGQRISMGEWARQAQDFDRYRRVEETYLIGADGQMLRVSTVLLGNDYNFFGVGPPIIFETMIFGDLPKGADGFPVDEFLWRYATKEQAAASHRKIVASLMKHGLSEIEADLYHREQDG